MHAASLLYAMRLPPCHEYSAQVLLKKQLDWQLLQLWSATGPSAREVLSAAYQRHQAMGAGAGAGDRAGRDRVRQLQAPLHYHKHCSLKA